MQTKTPLDVTTVKGRSVLWLDSSRLNECLEAYRNGDFSALGINYARGFHLDSIDVLLEHPYVSDLEIVPPAQQYSLAPLKRLDRLRSLVLNGDATQVSIVDFPDLEEFRGYWHPKLLSDHSRLRILDLSDFRSASGDLRPLPEGLPSLEVLELVRPRKLTSLVAISGYRRLRQVQVVEARGLVTLSDIHKLENLMSLTCDACRKLTDIETILRGLSIEILRLHRCSPLSSLQFLNTLPKLEEFRFVETDVTDGDLRPLLRLRRVGFLAKRHFSHTPEQIMGAIGQTGP